MSKVFKIASVSSNTNSFGLTGMILIARDGEAWQVGANSYYLRTKGDVVRVPLTGKRDRNFAALGFEIPEKLQDAPPPVVKEVWRSTRPT